MSNWDDGIDKLIESANGPDLTDEQLNRMWNNMQRETKREESSIPSHPDACAEFYRRRGLTVHEVTFVDAEHELVRTECMVRLHDYRILDLTLDQQHALWRKRFASAALTCGLTSCIAMLLALNIWFSR